MRTILTLGVCVLSLQSFACLNDTDTLRMAKEKFPEAVDVIAGRFERNPPLYYQMRIARLTPLVAKDPSQLGYYDDIAVACDRIGDDTSAIAWMAKKRAQLDRLGKAAPEYHEYSYHANLGTFLIHEWLHRGAPRADLRQADEARDHIARAIEIKPNAHFGREPVQLATMDWVIGVVRNKGGKPLSLVKAGALNAKDTFDGMLGLVVLGAAWESVDMFGAIESDPYVSTKSTTVRRLAQMRVGELRGQGKRSLLEIASGQKGRPWAAPVTDQEFKALRDNAEAYTKHRQDFMLAKLRAGKHPDTDPDFWDGYREVPRYVPPWTMSEVTHWLGPEWAFKVGFGGIVALLVLLYVLSNRRRAKGRLAIG